MPDVIRIRDGAKGWTSGTVIMGMLYFFPDDDRTAPRWEAPDALRPYRGLHSIKRWHVGLGVLLWAAALLYLGSRLGLPLGWGLPYGY